MSLDFLTWHNENEQKGKCRSVYDNGDNLHLHHIMVSCLLQVMRFLRPFIGFARQPLCGMRTYDTAVEL